MNRAAAVVVEVDSVLDRRGDEAEHHLAIVLLGVGVVSHFMVDAKVNAEACSQPLHAAGNAVLREQLRQSGTETLRDRVDVRVEIRARERHESRLRRPPRKHDGRCKSRCAGNRLRASSGA